MADQNFSSVTPALWMLSCNKALKFQFARVFFFNQTAAITLSKYGNLTSDWCGISITSCSWLNLKKNRSIKTMKIDGKHQIQMNNSCWVNMTVKPSCLVFYTFSPKWSRAWWKWMERWRIVLVFHSVWISEPYSCGNWLSLRNRVSFWIILDVRR